jgi:hypothetical protein
MSAAALDRAGDFDARRATRHVEGVYLRSQRSLAG